MIHTNRFQNKTVYRFYRVKMTSRFNENEMLTYLSAIWERFWGKIIGYMKKKMQSSRFPLINHMVNDKFINSLYWKHYDNWEYSRLLSPQFSWRHTHIRSYFPVAWTIVIQQIIASFIEECLDSHPIPKTGDQYEDKWRFVVI